MPEITNDPAIRALRYALDGLSLRQQAVAQNIANLNTPGYKAARVSFEEELQRRLRGSGDAVDVSLTHPAHVLPSERPGVSITRDASTSIRLDGNNVDIDWEMARLAETVINYNTVTELISMKLAILKTAIKGG
ncbi:MAG: flagellar basal body rod protein FlgB [Anaerolineae bacterium]|nr:flagellar basal body rod protein FlgB [Anaerolineae bacterium]